MMKIFTQNFFHTPINTPNYGKYSKIYEFKKLLEIRYFERKSSKILKKSNFPFVFEPSLFYRHKKRKGLELVFRSFLSLLIHHMANIDALIQIGFRVIQKLAIDNLYKPFHDPINIPLPTSS